MWRWLKRIFPSEHEWASQQLSAYLDDELSPSDRARVEAHLQECPICAEELHTLRWAVSLTAQMPTLKAPRSFLITEATAHPRRAPLSTAYLYLRGATVAVAALLLVVLASDFLLPYILPSRMPAPPAAFPVAEKEVVEEAEQKPVALTALPIEQAPEKALRPRRGEVESERELPAEKEAVASTLAPPAPTPTRTPISTPPPPRRAVKVEAVPSLQPTPFPTATERAGRPSPPWRSTLRLTEVGLGLLMVLLAGGALMTRACRPGRY